MNKSGRAHSKKYLVGVHYQDLLLQLESKGATLSQYVQEEPITSAAS